MAPETVRTVPPWVVTRPLPSILPQHNSSPSQPQRSRPSQPEPYQDPETTSSDPNKPLLPHLFKRNPGGRKWDHLRSAEPVIVPRHRLAVDTASPWREMVESSRYPHIPNEESEVVDEDVMAKLQPSFGYPIQMPRATHTIDTRRTVQPWYQRVMLLPLRHPLGPLACRLTVLATSIIALSLAVHIFRQESLYGSPTAERTQIIVAIVVDVVAVPYIGYITVDDYTGKPLGLRPAKERIRLILVDLLFIIFKSASTALGFEAMLYFSTINTVAHLRALSAFELIGLLSWAMTLTINVFREIERLGG